MNFGPSDGVVPVKIDSSVRFSSIGGLKEHIKCLREMIIFPLMYPELFKKFNTRPAKGILFHGPPGTGKTLLARALANECSLVGGRRVSFFMRKGADVMNKYYGESERNLRVLFQTARKMKPSIIFFDEIDALAPARRPTNDTTHASVVATLLAEMDGVCDRGDVIVIGATNRPDAMDPAVRRAGRFDRELYFPPPEREDRRDILEIYTKDWDPELSKETLDDIAKLTVGYLGSDIKALCSEAVLKAVRRVYPQIYESDCKLLINAQNVEVTKEDMLAAMEAMVPTGARYAPQAARPLPPHTIALLQDQLKAATDLMYRTLPPRGHRRNKSKQGLGTAPSVFLVSGECAETLLAPALLAQMEHCIIKELSVSTLHAGHVLSPENAIISLFADCRRSGLPCVIYIRDLSAVWNVLSRKNGNEVLLQLWRVGSDGENTLLLATCRKSYNMLPKQLQEVFPVYKDCIYRIRRPTEAEVANFLMPVMIELPMVPPIVYKKVPPPPLPRAPIGPSENEQEAIHRLFKEYDDLRIMRGYLKNIIRNLMSQRRFQSFATPVDVDILPDYFSIIKQPMDLTTMSCKIDDKQYYCAKEFLDDIDLICANALLYDRTKPHKTDKKFRQEACSLHLDAYEKTFDDIPASLELECQLIARRRREQGGSKDEYEHDDWGDDFYVSKLGNNDIRKAIKEKENRSRKRQATEKYVENLAKKVKSGPRACPRYCGESTKDGDEIEIKPKKECEQLNPFTDDVVMSCANQTKGPNLVEANKGIEPVEANDDCANETKRNQPNEDDAPTVPDIEINPEELEYLLSKSLPSLCQIGLEALIDLHAQLSRTVYSYAHKSNRKLLPRDLEAIVTRYLRHARR